MNTRQKGEVAKLQVMLRAAERGLVVSEPTVDARYDLIIDYGGELERAQVKWGGGRSHRSRGAFKVELRSDSHTSNGSSTYQDGEVDCLLLYVPDFGVVRLPPDLFVGKSAVNIRVEPPMNGQRKGIVMASDYSW